MITKITNNLFPDDTKDANGFIHFADYPMYQKIIDKKIVVPITKIVVLFSDSFKQSSKKIEKWLSKSNTLLFLSLFLAIITFVIIDQKILLFSENSAEVLKEQPVIIFDDFTTSFHWVDFDFKVKSSAMKMLTPCNEEANFRFIYYAMKCIKYETLEHSRQWISTYSQFEIPLPPLEEQARIVSILDRFEALTTDLQSGLPAEIEARRQQYEYYRNKLLTFEQSA